MNKLFTKVAKLGLGLAMAAGVGVAIASNSEAAPVHAAANNTTFSKVTSLSDLTDNAEVAITNTGGTVALSTTQNSNNRGQTSISGSSGSFTYSTSSSVQVLTIRKWTIDSKTYYGFHTGSGFLFSPSANNYLKTNTEAVTTNPSSVQNYTFELSISNGTITANCAGRTAYYLQYNSSSSIFSCYKKTQANISIFKAQSACTVTLNKNGGSGGTDSVSATKGSAMPTLASAPTRTGYTFAGYYDDASAGTQYYTANRASARNWDKDGTTATLYAHWTANQYNINYYDQGGSDFSGEHVSGYPTKHTYGTETTLKGATRGGYNFDGWFTSSECTGSAVTTLGATSYTDAINLYAKWTATGNIYSITTTVTNGIYSGDTTITDNGGVASVTIAPTGDYKLPASVSVSGADHTYNASTGAISLSNATGNVTISAAMVALTEYSITVNETNGSHTGASTIKESRTASLTFEPDTNYGNPADVTVSGATYTWTRGTGVLSLSNPTGNVTVTYVACENELTSIILSANSGSYTLGDAFVKPVITARYSVAADQVVTNSPNVEISGYDPYVASETPQEVTISYTEGGITKSASYYATVSANEIETITTWTRVTSAATLKAGGTFILGYEATANSGVIIPMANTGSATTSTAGFMYSGSTASSGGTGTINMSTLGDNGSDFEIAVGASSAVNDAIYLKVGDNYIGNQDTKNNCKLFAEQSATTSFGVSVGSNDVLTLTIAANSSYTTLQYNSGSPRFAVYGGTQKNLVAYQKVTESSGSASLIRIVCDPLIDPETGYKGGDKFVGDTVYTTDFVVKKQLDTGNELTAITGFTINGGSEVELTSTSNTITVSYTEGGIPKSTEVVVAATERAAELESVQLVEKGEVKKSGYIDFASATWNLDNIYVHYYWSDDEFDTEVTLASLVATEDASISPIKPTVGATSFTVSYEYLEVQITNNTITLTEAVRSDYVASMSWGNTTAAHFKHFSGEQLTEEIVNTWHVKATYAGAGEGSRLYWGDYDLYIGNKQITSLPYTWLSEDDGQALSIHYGEDVDGNEFVKTNDTAVGNICATINAIDHDETATGLLDKTATWTKEQSAEIYDGGSNLTELCDNGVDIDTNIHMQGDSTAGSTAIRFWNDGIRCYNGNKLTFTPKNGAVITKITFASTGISFDDGVTDSSSSPFTINDGYGDSAITLSFALSSTVKMGSDVVVEYQIEGSETTTVHYANQMEHFDAQKKVVEFAKFMNTTMNGSNVCSGTFANLEDAWDDVAGKYDELFGASTTLNTTELAWAKKMLEYATAAWGSDAELACVEKAMKTYEHCTSKYELTPFMDGVRSAGAKQVSPLMNVIGENSNTIAIIVIISMVSMTTIGAFFFIRKRKENI